MNRKLLVAAAATVAVGALAAIGLHHRGSAASHALPPLGADGWTLDRAIDESADYLTRAAGPDGRFEYRLFTDGTHGNPRRYNIVRHAGAIYAMSDYTRQATPSSRARAGATVERATRYMLSQYVRPLRDHPEVKAVWSDPKEEGGQRPGVKLGAVGLGLIGLMGKMRAADDGAIDAGPPEARAEELATGEALARFVQMTIKPAGDFRGRYEDERGYIGDSESLYYPGEAILGLTMLYERDHDPQWLALGVRAIHFLVESRKKSNKRYPADHWLMIAIDRMLPVYGAIPDPPLTREETLRHAVDIGKVMIEDMRQTDERRRGDPELDGSFNPEGRTAPNATRLEGLLALEHAIADEPAYAEFRKEVRTTIGRGIAFLRRSQIKEGPARGGQPGALRVGNDRGEEEDERDRPDGGTGENIREVRIDYVQHAMSAMMRYRAMCREAGADVARVGFGCDYPP